MVAILSEVLEVVDYEILTVWFQEYQDEFDICLVRKKYNPNNVSDEKVQRNVSGT